MATRRQRRARDRQGGQVILLMAAAVGVIIAFTGLAVDSAQAVLHQNRAQAAADFAALAAASELGGTVALPGAGDPAITGAAQSATLNGFPTVASNNCTLAAPASFDITFYDQRPTACPTPPADFTYSVQIVVPAVHYPQGSGCNTFFPRCAEIYVTYIQNNVLGGVVAQPRFTVTAFAVAIYGIPARLLG